MGRRWWVNTAKLRNGILIDVCLWKLLGLRFLHTNKPATPVSRNNRSGLAWKRTELFSSANNIVEIFFGVFNDALRPWRDLMPWLQLCGASRIWVSVGFDSGVLWLMSMSRVERDYDLEVCGMRVDLVRRKDSKKSSMEISKQDKIVLR